MKQEKNLWRMLTYDRRAAMFFVSRPRLEIKLVLCDDI